MPEFFLKSSPHLNYMVIFLRSSVDRKIVVVAQSARLLSQMAVNAGLLPIAVDCFADLDTRLLSLECIRVESLNAEDLVPALRDIAARHGVGRLVYGSGFEAHPDSLELIEREWPLLANPVWLFRRLLDKREFFTQLRALDIDHPQTTFSQPLDAEGWLYKPNQGQGGAGIVHAGSAMGRQQNGYWQQWLDGEVYSALFIADGDSYKIIGFNRQWTATVNELAPFMFAGIHNQAKLDACHRRTVNSWLKCLLAIYPLRGLGSLDFMVSDGHCYLLEINPRIPASAQLYDRNLLSLHLAVCQGALCFRRKFRTQPRGYQIVFSDDDLRIPLNVSWPPWAVDLPAPGTIIGQGMPICSIIAGGKNARHVCKRLQQRQLIIEHFLNIRTITSHAIPSKRQ